MITIIPQSISATSLVLTSNIEERLCKPYCVNTSIAPTIDVTYTVDDTYLVGTTLYVKVKAQGTITYLPKNECLRTVPFAEYFIVSFAGADATSSVTIAQADGIINPAYIDCCNIAKGISALNVVTLTFTA